MPRRPVSAAYEVGCYLVVARVLRESKDGATIPRIVEATCLSRRIVVKALRQAVKSGEVEHQGFVYRWSRRDHHRDELG